MTSCLKLKFGDIAHGWLPFALSTNDGEFVIDASDIPIDPVLQIIKAVEEVCLYQAVSEAWFSLEPNYYKIIFEPLYEKIIVLVFDDYSVSLEKNSRV
jgi:hypothetical protein